MHLSELAAQHEALDAALLTAGDRLAALADPAADYKKLEARARKATPRSQAQFLIPWIIAHATPDQRNALFRSAPPLRLAYRLNHRRYRRLDQALARTA